MDATPDPLPPVPPLQRHLQLETDLFCHGCGYNLHGQIVTMDERLGFLICRCPECGRFHPAAMGVSATRPWLARLGVMLIVNWVIFVLFVLGFCGFFIGLCTYAHLETYTERTFANNEIIRTLRPPAINANYYYRQDEQWKYFITWNIVLSLFVGIFTAAGMWHLSRARLQIFLGYGAFIGLFVMFIWWLNYNIDPVLGWSIQRVLGYTALSVALIAVGQRIGRPVTRFVIRLLVPAKLRQHVNFLWRCDGLTPPTATEQ